MTTGLPFAVKQKFEIHKSVGILFQQLLEIPEGCQTFCNQWQICSDATEPLIKAGGKITGIATSMHNHDLHEWEGDLFLLEHPDLALFNPLDKFHLGFSAFPFEINFDAIEKDRVKPLMIQDRCEFFKCSEGKEERRVAYHILGLEQLLKATLEGGYFGAVLPKNYVGREMKYLRWWENNAALVCKIRLPPEAVKVAVRDEMLNAPGEWMLCIWNRPLSEGSKFKQASYAKFRFSPFIFPLESFGKHLDDCVHAFHASEWYSMSVHHWHETLEKLHSDYNWGSYRSRPLEVDDPKEIYFFNPKTEFRTGLRVVDSKEDIAKIKHAVHVKPGRVIKLSCHLDHSKPQTAQEAANQCALLDLRTNLGTVTEDKTGALLFNYDVELKYRPFMDIRERLIALLEDQGLVPCMTKDDYHKMQKRERWLQIQLTPIERMIPASKAASIIGNGQQSGEAADWEKAYEDTGMWSTFPEIMQMWKRRATQMNMDRHCFEFQFNDLIYYVAKDCLDNSSVMGLGKTRLSLFAALLRCAKRNLFIVPARLLGVWQDEIDNTIVPYCRFQRKDWQGNILDPSYQIIEWAKDLYPANMKTFNFISFDKAKTIARDGRFYKCPRCGTVVYSGKNLESPPVCPGDSAVPDTDPRRCDNLIKHWKRICAGPTYEGNPGERYAKRKFRVVADENGEPFKDSDGSYVRVHWSKLVDINGEQFPLERTVVVDERPARPIVPVMEPQENMFKKVRKTIVDYETNPQTGERVPIYKNVERSPHLRWSMAHLLRNRFSHIYLDEALAIMNEDSMRSMAVNCINGRQRVINTGTPMKNRPQNILGMFNWCFPREVFPDYRTAYDPQALNRFLKKYKTEVYVGGFRMPDGQILGGVPKQIPKVNNPELFQAEMAPLMLRHTRNEPLVLKDIPRKVVIEKHETVKMDDEHRAYYKRWLVKFAEWWQKMKEEEEDEKVPPGALLTKLTYLINASTIPHFMLDGILEGKDDEAKAWAREIGVYKGKQAPAKMRRCWEMIKQNIAQGDKTIASSWRRANLNLGQNWCQKQKIASMIVDGTISLTINKGTGRSKRHEMVEQFRHYDFYVLWAGLEALSEGFNIPEANHCILLDCGWAPTQPRQLIGRMIRPQQTKTIYANYVMHEGTIDDYMFALSYLKGRSADEAIDYMEFDDFSTDIIPDIHQYADSIVDGTEEKIKQVMWLAVDHLKRQIQEEGEDEA
jgi:hypothetical protein